MDVEGGELGCYRRSKSLDSNASHDSSDEMDLSTCTNSVVIPESVMGSLSRIASRPWSRSSPLGSNFPNRKGYAAVVSRHSPAAQYLAQFNNGRGRLVPPSLREDETSTREVLFRELRKIHDEQWIEAYRLQPEGTRLACDAPNCHGVTLESELGITANGLAQPDYLDWEVKAHRVGHLNAHLSSRIILLTPNPDSGEAKDKDTT